MADSPPSKARQTIEEAEDAARYAMEEADRRFTKVWRKTGLGGKVFIALLFFGQILPLIIEIGAALVLWLAVYPHVSGDIRWAVIGSVLSLLLGLSIQVSTMARKGWLALYILAGPKRKKVRPR